ncbi:MAG: alanine racemase [Chlorobi bacterium CHB2]|nr:alanine racemase [Chlorobi bacterium CHB2]
MSATRAMIDRAALRNNLGVIRRTIPPTTRVMGVVKANCYGHSTELSVPVLLDEGIDLFGVANVEEGRRLRQSGVEGTIVVLGPPIPGSMAAYGQHRLEALVSNERMATQLAESTPIGASVNVHLFVDTGMARNGAGPNDAVELLRLIATLPQLNIVGFASHFATSDEPENPFALQQIEIFRTTLGQATDAGFRFRDVHLANSGGIFNFPDSHYSVVRPGLSLYGYHPTQSRHASSGLLPVMHLHTRVANVTRFPAGVSVSYGRRYFTQRETEIATLPIGYGDGLMRTLTNNLNVLIAGGSFPVVGTICMDEVMVDLGPDSGVQPGQAAVLIGRSGDRQIGADQLAEAAGTIPYEICTNVSARVPRIAADW